MTHWAQAAELAELQHLVVTTWQLQRLGWSRQSITRRAARDGWRRWSPGVYLLPGPITPLRRLAAAVLGYSRPVDADQRLADLRGEDHLASVADIAEVGLKSGAVVCGLSAAWLHGLDKAPNQSWIRVRTHCGHAPRRATRLCHGTYVGKVVWIEGLPVVDVEQALIDVAGMTDDSSGRRHHRLTRLIATADALRKTDLDRLERRIAESPMFRGRPALLRACADLRGQLTHSAPERQARVIVAGIAAAHGLTVAPRPHPIRLDGAIVGEADIAILDIQFDIEVDGPHHLLPAQRVRDDARDRSVRRANWHVERYSTELIELTPDEFEAQVTATIQHLVGTAS